MTDLILQEPGVIRAPMFHLKNINFYLHIPKSIIEFF